MYRRSAVKSHAALRRFDIVMFAKWIKVRDIGTLDGIRYLCCGHF